jgi:hypothetical protein
MAFMNSPLPRGGGGDAGVKNQIAATAAANTRSTTRVDVLFSSARLGFGVEFIFSPVRGVVGPLFQ